MNLASGFLLIIILWVLTSYLWSIPPPGSLVDYHHAMWICTLSPYLCLWHQPRLVSSMSVLYHEHSFGILVISICHSQLPFPGCSLVVVLDQFSVVLDPRPGPYFSDLWHFGVFWWSLDITRVFIWSFWSLLRCYSWSCTWDLPVMTVSVEFHWILRFLQSFELIAAFYPWLVHFRFPHMF